MLSALNRHPWSRAFARWLESQGFFVIVTPMERAGGLSELIEIGRFDPEARKTLFFLHGLGNDALFPNIAFYRALLMTDFNIVFADLDGHGKGLTSVFASQTITTLVEDMIAHSQLLKNDRSELHLAGYSLGAVLMLDYAARHTTRVIKKLSLIGMPLILQNDLRIASEALTPFLKSYRQALPDYGLLGIQPAIGPILRNRYPIRLAPNEKSSYFQIAGQVVRDLLPTNEIQKIKCPVIFIAGSQDYIGYSTATANFLDSMMASNNIKREIIPGETHFSVMLASKTPELVADLLQI
jgi:pimeloyl-ACP methyl ester carboxylesterase